jgi:hypothetical protein
MGYFRLVDAAMVEDFLRRPLARLRSLDSTAAEAAEEEADCV